MTDLELIQEHCKSTGGCSVMHHAKKSSKTYNQIIARGENIVPEILRFLKSEGANMFVIMLLMDITQEMPYIPKRIGDSQLASWDVKTATKEWLKWGKEKKLI